MITYFKLLFNQSLGFSKYKIFFFCIQNQFFFLPFQTICLYAIFFSQTAIVIQSANQEDLRLMVTAMPQLPKCCRFRHQPPWPLTHMFLKYNVIKEGYRCVFLPHLNLTLVEKSSFLPQSTILALEILVIKFFLHCIDLMYFI